MAGVWPGSTRSRLTWSSRARVRHAGGDRLSEASGSPTAGFVKNSYVGRTFIQPSQRCASSASA